MMKREYFLISVLKLLVFSGHLKNMNSHEKYYHLPET